MLKIGEFSRLVNVPVKTLRYYDEIGLFKSDYIDEQTGYRFYSFEQLPRLNRLLALKDLGLSLSQIDQMLRENLSADQLRDMLSLETGRTRRPGQRYPGNALPAWELRLSLIEMEDKMPDYEVVIKTVDPVLVVSKQEAIPQLCCHRLCDGPPVQWGCRSHVVKHKGQFAGPGITVWHEWGENLQTRGKLYRSKKPYQKVMMSRSTSCRVIKWRASCITEALKVFL